MNWARSAMALNKGVGGCESVFHITSGLCPLAAAHTNAMRQDPVGQLTLTLQLQLSSHAYGSDAVCALSRLWHVQANSVFSREHLPAVSKDDWSLRDLITVKTNQQR